MPKLCCSRILVVSSLTSVTALCRTATILAASSVLDLARTVSLEPKVSYSALLFEYVLCRHLLCGYDQELS
jgi:hypothetical protein